MDGSVILTHDPAGGQYERTADAILAFAINDNDRPQLALDTSPAVAGEQLTTMQLAEGDSEGRSKRYTLRLAMQPSADVAVAITSDTPGAVVPAPSALTFQRGLWDVPQTVTATAQDDLDGADERAVKIRHVASGGDYAGVSRNLSVDVVDDDEEVEVSVPVVDDGADVSVPADDAAPPALAFDAAALAVPPGDSHRYTVALATPPSAAVTVRIAVAGPVTVSPSTLTFDTDNWREPQTVEVRAGATGAPSAVATLSHRATGGGYGGVAADLSVYIVGATPGLSVSAAALAIDEGEQTSYELRLNTQPDDQATVIVGVRGEGVYVVPNHVTFDAESWNRSAAITVHASADADAEDGRATLTHTLTGYGDVTTGPSVQVTIRDRPAAALLSALWLHPGELTPEFAPATRSYRAAVASDVANATVLAVASSPQAEVVITPSDASPLPGHQIPLVAGNNEVVVRVQNGEDAADYTVRIARTTSRQPEVATQLPPVALEAGASETIDLGPGFRDPDGDPLVYTAISDDPRIATVDVLGRRAEIAALADGSASIVATATDPTGLEASQSIPVSVGNVVEFKETSVAVAEGEKAVLTVARRRAEPVSATLKLVIHHDEDPDTHNADHHDYHEHELAVAIPAGATSAAVGFDIHDDEHIEPLRETFIVRLEAMRNVPLGHAHKASVTIHEGVCDRLPRIQQEIVSITSGGCEAVSADDLASRKTLDLSACRDCALRPGDLDGFVNLRQLSLAGSGLEALPSGGFAALSRLRALDLSDNRLAALPPQVFEGLASLEEVDLSANPGAPFTLTVELDRQDAESSAPGPAALALRVAEGAPFPMQVWLASKNAWMMAESKALMAGALLGRGQIAVPFAVLPAVESMAWTWPVAAPAIPRSLCGGRPCYRGLKTAMAKKPMALFERDMPEFVPPAIPMPLADDEWVLSLDEIFAEDPAAGPLEYEATSSNPAVATAAVRDGALVVGRSVGGEGPVTITVMASAAGRMASTLRFTTTVEVGHRPFLRGWRLALGDIAAPSRAAAESSTRQAALRN